jgi:hypothetical protein
VVKKLDPAKRSGCCFKNISYMRQQKRFAKTVWCIKEVMRLTNQTVDIVGMVMERGDEKKIER